MSAQERNFNNYVLGDNVYELADQLIPEIAERLDITLGNEPNSEDLGALVGAIGANKVTRDNAEITAIDRDTQVSFVERSSVQEKLDRSLWTPKFATTGNEIFVLTGAVANWQDRGAAIAEQYTIGATVYLAAGERVMKSATEIVNPNVVAYFEEHGEYPTESQYVSTVIAPRLNAADLVVVETLELSAKGDELAEQLFAEHPELLEEEVAFARVANAGIQLAVQMCTAARKFNPEFDADPESPQAYVVTDSFPVARTEEQESQPAQFQKAATALRQVAVTAKMLHEANN